MELFSNFRLIREATNIGTAEIKPVDFSLKKLINEFFPFKTQPIGHPVFRRNDYYIKVIS